MKKLKIFQLLLATLLLASCNDKPSDFPSTNSVDSTTQTTSDFSVRHVSVDHTSKDAESNVSSSDIVDSTTSDSTVISVDPSTLETAWQSLDFTVYGNTFRKNLQSAIQKQHTARPISYSECLSMGAKAASYPLGSNNFVPFYHAAPDVTDGVTGDGVKTTTQGSCNREHVWPDSRGCGKTGPGQDPFIIRPTLTKDNSNRGNNMYDAPGSKTVFDPASYGYEAARGEAARIILYAATAYYGTCGTGGSSKGSEPLELTNNTGDASVKHTMGKLSTLLKWNMQYPATAMEKQINNYLNKQGLGRNPFVDHPDWANYIWDDSGIRKSRYAGGNDPVTDPDTPVTSVDRTKYNKVRALADLDLTKPVYIVSYDNTDSSIYVCLKDEAVGPNLPWYLQSTTIDKPLNDSFESADALTGFTVTNSSGYYQFKTDNGYLYSYVDGNHYSIGIASSPEKGSKNWTVTYQNNDPVLKGEDGVYLEYFHNTKGANFCGYSSAPSNPISFYQAA